MAQEFRRLWTATEAKTSTGTPRWSFYKAVTSTSTPRKRVFLAPRENLPQR